MSVVTFPKWIKRPGWGAEKALANQGESGALKLAHQSLQQPPELFQAKRVFCCEASTKHSADLHRHEPQIFFDFQPSGLLGEWFR